MQSLLTKEESQKNVILKKEGNVFILVLNKEGGNTFCFDFIRAINVKLDEVEKTEGAACLMTVSTDPKLFSTGLDLKALMGLTGPDIHNFLLEVIRLFGRFLAFSIPTVAVLNGHAFAGGCMLAMSHDYRIMNSQKGFVCMNEVELGFPLPPGMNAVCQCKLSPQTHRDLILTAKRYNAKNALSDGVVDKIETPEKLFETSLNYAEELSKYGVDRANFKKLKEEMHKVAIDACFNKGLAVGVRAEGGPAILPKI